MNVFVEAARAGLMASGTKAIPKEDGVGQLSELCSFIENTQKELLIVAGGLESSVYEKPEIVERLDTLLGEKKGKVYVFLGSQDWKTFWEGHPNIWKLYSRYAAQIELYCAGSQDAGLERHFTVSDGVNLLYEDKHPSGAGRDVYYKYNSPRDASAFRRLFFDVISDSGKS